MHVFERYFLNCPYARAREYLREALDPASYDGTGRTMVPAPRTPFFPGSAEKRFLVQYERGFDSMHFDEPWRVFWTPEGGGAYPDFAGELTVRTGESYRRSILELRGEYEPPPSSPDTAFDVVLGAKIAALTARELLAQIAERIESRYAQEAVTLDESEESLER